MHDIDSAQVGFGYEPAPGFHTQRPVFSESKQAAMAAKLMEVGSEAEFENFLGDLISGAGKAIGKLVSSPTGQALGGLLKGAAKQLLPMAGTALGGFVGGPAGAALGGQLASSATNLFESEAEAEEQEWEAANTFVKLAGDAVKHAAIAPPGDPRAIAQKALLQAAQIHAPGLVIPAAPPAPVAGGGASGQWVRRGNRIILFGA